MSNLALHDFIITVPSCYETTQLAVVWEIFTSNQCDRLVVVNQQQCLVGVLHLYSLLPHLNISNSKDDLVKSLCELKLEIKPIVTIPAQLTVAQFSFELNTINPSLDWALVNLAGEFIGLIDSQRLLQYLAALPTASNEIELSTLSQLLHNLPWPLMLQTSSGEVVTQNPAWWQQFADFNDPQEIGQEVKALLENTFTTLFTDRPLVESPQLEELSRVSSHSLRNDHRRLEVAPIIANHLPESSSTRCQLGTQPGTCVCSIGKNGQERAWQFIKIPLDLALLNSNCHSQIWLVLATDITKEQHLTAELAAKNVDLIQLNRLKDEFLACISHELKTPLTAVLGLSTLLKDQTMGQLNDRQTRYASLIHQSARHLTIVVNDILDLARMETGQLELTLQPVQIRAVCDRALQQANIQSETRTPTTAQVLASDKHDFTLSIEPGLDLVADELRLRQMLIHLLANAFKFTEAGGEIGLQVSRWESWIAFTVWDTGIGIPEHQQHLIFKKFQQLENPLTRQFEGTGLGLVLTRTLARLHGGDVSFLSIEGKGSQFTLLLPPNPSLKNGETGATTSGIILIVEAAPQFIEDLTAQLTSLGDRFAVARSGTEAIEKARRLQPKAIFLNPFLPLLSGWDVLRLLKSDLVTSQIPVIITAAPADRQQAVLNQADGFLSLPVQQQDLQEVLAKLRSQNSVCARTQQAPLTILRLVNNSSISVGDDNSRPEPADYSSFALVLEADDLAQAELLAKVWQPHVVLLAVALPDPVTYLKQLSQHSTLRSLPIITLEATTTQAAVEAQLSVFPYLTSTSVSIDTLLPVIEIAMRSSDRY